MHRVLLIAASAVVGVVAGYLGPKLVACFRPDAPTLLPFPTLQPQGRSRRGRLTNLQPSHNDADLNHPEHDDR